MHWYLFPYDIPFMFLSSLSGSTTPAPKSQAAKAKAKVKAKAKAQAASVAEVPPKTMEELKTEISWVLIAYDAPDPNVYQNIDSVWQPLKPTKYSRCSGLKVLDWEKRSQRWTTLQWSCPPRIPCDPTWWPTRDAWSTTWMSSLLALRWMCHYLKHHGCMWRYVK